MKGILIFGLIVFISGCDVRVLEPDPELRRELFKECMQLLPKGPDTTMYNDWAEVVDECKSYAYYGSKVCVQGCRGNEL